MQTLTNIGYFAASFAVLCGLWICTGFVARFVVWLFCLGYGCT